MEQNEYILTSDDEAFALGERGRRLVLAMALAAYTSMLRQQLVSLKEAWDERSWNDYESNAANNYLGGMRGTAYDLLKAACAVPPGEHSYRSQGLYRLHTKVTGERILHALTYFNEPQWRRDIPVFMALYHDALDGSLQTALELAYAATDPTLAPEYAAALLPESCRG